MSDLTVTNRDVWNNLAHVDPEATLPLMVLRKADLPMRISNNIRKLVRKASEAFPDVSEGRNDLIAKHAQRDEEGNPVTFDEGRQTALVDSGAYLKELDDLMAIPVVLTDVRPIFLSEVGKVPLSADAIELLGAFLVDDEGVGSTTA